MPHIKELSHSGVEGRIITYMKIQGWYKTNHPPIASGGFRPDIIFTDNSGQFIYTEVKPSRITRRELLRGIGQTLQVLLLGESIGSLYVCPDLYNNNSIQGADAIGLVIGIFELIKTDKLYLITFNQQRDFSLSFGVLPQVKILPIDDIIPYRTELHCSDCGHVWVTRKRNKRCPLMNCCSFNVSINRYVNRRGKEITREEVYNDGLSRDCQ